MVSGADRAGSVELLDEQLRILIENALHVTAILNGDGDIRYVSPAIERMLGYSPEQLIGSSFLVLVHPEDAGLMRSILDGKSAASGRFIEFRALHRDHSLRVLEAITTNRLEEPAIAGIVIDARDVTERKWSADRLQRSLDALLAIHDVGRLLGSRLEQQEICSALLAGAMRIANIEAASLTLRTAGGRLRVAKTVGNGAPSHSSRAGRAAHHRVLRSLMPQFFSVTMPGGSADRLEACALPLRVQDGVLGILEVYGRAPVDAWPVDELGTLADQAASALERARLYEALTEREQRLEKLVRQLMLTQEEERRRVAFEIHDGLAQLTAAAHQHLEAFAARYHTRRPERAEELRVALTLASRSVQEARRTIAGLRPSVLDDFGLAPAIHFEIQGLRAEGWQVEYADTLGPTRMEGMLETALYRIFQEAVANVRKHARTTHVAVSLERRGRSVRLEVRDWGRGFQPRAERGQRGPSERVGLASMQERIALLHGRCTIRSRPGSGTRVMVEAPFRDSKARKQP